MNILIIVLSTISVLEFAYILHVKSSHNKVSGISDKFILDNICILKVELESALAKHPRTHINGTIRQCLIYISVIKNHLISGNADIN